MKEMKQLLRLVLFGLILFFSACTEEESTIFNPTPSDHYLMGNPSDAGTNVSTDAENLLIERRQYALSYSKTRATANWVSWHLSKDWLGGAVRQDNFIPDPFIPGSYPKAITSDYTNSGFDRGHLCPSADRTLSDEDNAATFYMSNIIPQSPNVNRGNWESLESYCRKLVSEGNELYITAGVYGEGGTGSNGGRTKRIDEKITVPEKVWKIIVVLPYGTNDLSRVNKNTRVIAVLFENMQSQGSLLWGGLRTSVNAIEALTGFDFLDSLPASVEEDLESQIDKGPTG